MDEEKKDDEKIDVMEKIRDFADRINKNYLAYFLMALALLACVYTLSTVGDYQQKCNEHWVNEIESKCICRGASSFNESFSITGDYEGEG